MKEIKCPKCGSKKVVCMDGVGTRQKYGATVMLEICPEIWVCEECGESFRVPLQDATPKIEEL